MNLEENSVIASDALIDNFPCSKSFLIFDRGCQSSGIRFLPFSSLLEEVWTLKYLNRKCRLVWNWSWYSFSCWSSPGYLLRSICYTAVLAQWTIFFFTWSFQKFGIKLPWLDMLFIEFQDFTDIRWSRHITSVVNWFFHVLWKVFTIKKERVFCTFWNTCVNVSPRVMESKTLLDSGFHTVDSGFHLLDSRSVSVELGFRIRIVSGIPDSYTCIPDSKAQDSGFHKQKFPRFRVGWQPS